MTYRADFDDRYPIMDIGDSNNLCWSQSDGVVTISGDNAIELSEENPAYICVQSIADKSKKIILKLKSNITFKDGNNVLSQLDASFWLDNGHTSLSGKPIFLVAINGDDTDDGLHLSLSAYPQAQYLVYLDELPYSDPPSLSHTQNIVAICLRNKPDTPYSNPTSVAVGALTMSTKTYGWGCDTISYPVCGKNALKELYKTIHLSSNFEYGTGSNYTGNIFYQITEDGWCKISFYATLPTKDSPSQIPNFRTPMFWNWGGFPYQGKGEIIPTSGDRIPIRLSINTDMNYGAANPYFTGSIGISREVDGSPITYADLYAIDAVQVKIYATFEHRYFCNLT